MSVNQSFDRSQARPQGKRGQMQAEIRSKEELITEEKVEGIILERVMKRLEGRGNEEESDPADQAEKLRVEVQKIQNAGNELVGIGRSIEALILHFNVTLEEYARGDAPAIKTNYEDFQQCFGANLPKLEQLVESEIEARSDMLEQQTQFDDFISKKVAAFMESKREMENQFLASYQTVYMKQQLSNNFAPAAWEPRLEKMTAFGQSIRANGKYAFEWPNEHHISRMNLDKKLQLQRISTNWTSLRAIQLHFTNELSSEPLDTGARSDPDVFKEFMLNVVPPPGQQKTIPVMEIGLKLSSNMRIHGLRIKYAAGDYYTMFEAEQGNWKAKTIPEGKEIIGLYGDFDDSGEHITTLGFILWSPNPQAS